jgi:hypothetical protein
MRELPHFAEGAHSCLCDLTSVATDVLRVAPFMRRPAACPQLSLLLLR